MCYQKMVFLQQARSEIIQCACKRIGRNPSLQKSGLVVAYILAVSKDVDCPPQESAKTG